MKGLVLRPLLRLSIFRNTVGISRGYAVQAPGTPTLQIFNRRAKYLQKERAALNVHDSRQADYLKDEVAMRLADRLLVRCASDMFDNETDTF